MTAIENPHAGQGMVVLDIGGDIGAIVVTTPADLAGAEIEICPAGLRGTPPDEGGRWWQGQWRSTPVHQHEHRFAHHHHEHGDGRAWPHVAVLGRPGLDRVVHAAVFPRLRAGQYELWVRPDGPSALTVNVLGGAVTEVVWPS